MLQTICVHLGFCIDFCEQKRLNALRLTNLNQREMLLLERQKTIKSELEYERRLVRSISSIAAWTCRSIANNANSNHNIEVDQNFISNNNEHLVNSFNDLFSLVPTASNILTKPKLKNVHLYVFKDDETHLHKLWTFDRKTDSFIYLKFNELDGQLKNKLKNGEPVFVDKDKLDHLRCGDNNVTYGGGDNDVYFSKTSDTSLHMEMLSQQQQNFNNVMLLPCQNPGGNIVGIITLHDDNDIDNSSLYGDNKMLSLLRDFAAHVALAVMGARGKQRSVVNSYNVQRRLHSSRRRASLIHSIEKLWSNSSETKDVFDLFHKECLGNVLRKTPVYSAHIYMVQRSGHMKSGQLWTYLKNSNEKVYLGTNSSNHFDEKHKLINRVLLNGESERCGKYVCVVARKETGQIMSLALAECKYIQEEEIEAEKNPAGKMGEDSSLDDNVMNKRINSINGKNDHTSHIMSLEEEAMLTMWCKHSAMAIRHFEALEQCIDGMADASNALVALQDQLKETKEMQKTHSIAIHRFHIAATAGIDVCSSVFEEEFIHRSLNNIGQINNENAFNLILKIEENATRLLAASSAIVLLRGEDISSNELIGLLPPDNDLYDNIAIEERMGDSVTRGNMEGGSPVKLMLNENDPMHNGKNLNSSARLKAYYRKRIIKLDDKDLPFVFQILQNSNPQRHLIQSNRDIDPNSAFGTIWNARVQDQTCHLGAQGPYRILGVPMLSSKNVAFGVILVVRGGLKSQTIFNSGDVEMLTIYSRLSLNSFLYQRRLEEYDRNVQGMALRNNMKLQQNNLKIKHSKRHYEILKFAISLTKHRTIHTLLQRATEQVARLLNCDLINIYLFDAKKQQLVLLDNDDHLSVDPDASIAISRSVFCSGIVEINRDDENGHNNILNHISPSLKSWSNKVERITCARIGIDLYKTGRLNEEDEKSSLVDDVLGKYYWLCLNNIQFILFCSVGYFFL